MSGFRKICIFFFIINMDFGIWVELGEATGVYRERDCGQEKTCLKVYRREKTAWLECLKKAGVSEKKRAVLARKTERFGISVLEKTEFLIFNTQRKNCHKNFSQALSDLENGREDSRRWPAPIDSLKEMIPGETWPKKS